MDGGIPPLTGDALEDNCSVIISVPNGNDSRTEYCNSPSLYFLAKYHKETLRLSIN